MKHKRRMNSTIKGINGKAGTFATKKSEMAKTVNGIAEYTRTFLSTLFFIYRLKKYESRAYSKIL